MLKETIKNSKLKNILNNLENISDVSMSIGSYYFKLRNGTVYGFDHKNN